MAFVIAFMFHLVVVSVVVLVVRKWPVAGLIAASILFLLYAVAFQQQGTVSWQVAHMSDPDAGSLRGLAGLFMVISLGVAVWALTRVIHSKKIR